MTLVLVVVAAALVIGLALFVALALSRASAVADRQREAEATVSARKATREPASTSRQARRRFARTESLSDQERRVLRALATGHTRTSAADELGLAPEAVSAHVESAMRKLDARTQAHAVANAFLRGEISVADLITGPRP